MPQIRCNESTSSRQTAYVAPCFFFPPNFRAQFSNHEMAPLLGLFECMKPQMKVDTVLVVVILIAVVLNPEVQMRGFLAHSMYEIVWPLPTTLHLHTYTIKNQPNVGRYTIHSYIYILWVENVFSIEWTMIL